MNRPGTRTPTRVTVYEDGAERTRPDELVTEEPMEIRLQSGAARRTVAVTMRTPGADFELAAGFLFGEGLVFSAGQIAGIAYCVDRHLQEEQRFNIVTVKVAGPLPDLPVLERHFLTSSACGVCGSATIESLTDRGVVEVPAVPAPETDLLLSLPETLRASQDVFGLTGGLHAAGLFDRSGAPVVVREDIGRHNAVDKVVGWALLQDKMPLTETILCVSGRAGYEIVQKAAVAGIPVVAAVSAPSSLAVATARAFNIHLIGFLRPNRLNRYTFLDGKNGALDDQERRTRGSR